MHLNFVLYFLNFRVKISIMGRENKIDTWMDVVYSPHHVPHVWHLIFVLSFSKISYYVFSTGPELALWSLAVASCSIRFNIQKLTILSTEFIIVFCTYLRTNRGLFPNTVLTCLHSWPIWKVCTARYEKNIELQFTLFSSCSEYVQLRLPA